MSDTTRNRLRDVLSPNNEVKEAKIPDVSQNDLSGMHGFSIDEYRPMKVVIIGAGFSGILAGIRFRQRIPNLQMTIYEKDDGIGGTWYANRYPSVYLYIYCGCIASR